jgi:hypothetical protein
MKSSMSSISKSRVKAPLSLSSFLLPDAGYPAKVYREYKVPEGEWQELGNDTIGDCIVAMIGHWLMLVTAHTGKMYTPTAEEIVRAYSAITGYDPSKTDAQGNNPTDTGTDIATIMQYMKTTGIGGIKIINWADVNIKDPIEQRKGIYAFGGILDAAYLPQSAVTQTQHGKAWSVTKHDGGILGGHGFPNFGYGVEGTDGVTWAKLQQIQWAWRLKYIMESAAAITPAWLDAASGLAPNMMDLDALNKALKG